MSQDLSRPIRDFMTTIPVVTESSASIQTVFRLLQRYDIRHIPVTENGHVIGLVYEKDIHSLMNIRGIDTTTESIHTIVSHIPLKVSPNTVTIDVIGEMAKKKFDAAFVMQTDKLVGIFTTIDALRLLHTNATSSK